MERDGALAGILSCLLGQGFFLALCRGVGVHSLDKMQKFLCFHSPQVFCFVQHLC